MKIIRKIILDELTHIVQDKTQEIYNKPEQTFKEKQKELKRELKKIYNKSYSTDTYIKRLDYIERVENIQIGYLPSIITGLIASLMMLVVTDNTITDPFSSTVEFIINTIFETNYSLYFKIIILLLCLLLLLFFVLLIVLPIFFFILFLFTNKILLDRNDLLNTYDYEKELLLKVMANSKNYEKKLNESSTSENKKIQNYREESKLDKFKLEVIPILLSFGIVGVLYNFNPINKLLNNFFNDGYFYVCLLSFVILYILLGWLFKKTRLRNLVIHGGKNETTI